MTRSRLERPTPLSVRMVKALALIGPPDGVTESMAFAGELLHHEANKPLCPGRGDGVV